MNKNELISHALFVGGGLLAKNVPGHVWLEFLAVNGAAALLGFSLNGGAPFGWDTSSRLPHAR